jgi:hypothetical protein
MQESPLVSAKRQGHMERIRGEFSEFTSSKRYLSLSCYGGGSVVMCPITGGAVCDL